MLRRIAPIVAGLLLAAVAWTQDDLRLSIPLWLAAVAAWWFGMAEKRAWLVAVPVLFAPPLGSRDVYAYACQGWTWWHGLNPYELGAAQAQCPWVGEVPEIWQDTTSPYGPLAIGLSGVAAAPGNLTVALGLFRLYAVIGAILLAYFLPRLGGQQIFMVLGLIVAVHGLSGAHYDLLLAGLVVAALALREKAWLAGALLACAIAIKVTAIVALPFLLIWNKRWTSLLATVVTYAGLSWATGLGLGWLGALRHTSELVQWSSPPTAVGMAIGYVFRLLGHEEWTGAAVTFTRAIGLVLLGLLGLYALRVAVKGKPLEACAIAATAMVLLGPVFYPWYAILPLALLTIFHNRRLAFIAIGCTLLTLPDGTGVPYLTKAVGAFAMTIGIVYLVSRSRAKA